MKVLYVYCHPVPESFHGAIRQAALEGLRQANYAVDLLDLYAEGFDPVLSADGRRRYHDTGFVELLRDMAAFTPGATGKASPSQ